MHINSYDSFIYTDEKCILGLIWLYESHDFNTTVSFI